ncbi:hypothetical protein GCM10009696_10770 [Kocuria himachalensis]
MLWLTDSTGMLWTPYPAAVAQSVKTIGSPGAAAAGAAVRAASPIAVAVATPAALFFMVFPRFWEC